MESEAITYFARAWIASQQKWERRNGLPDDDPDMEIVYDLMRLARENWEAATAICIEVAKQSEDPMILEILGVSPIEDILHYHSDEVLPSFLEAAKVNPRFRLVPGAWSCVGSLRARCLGTVCTDS